MNPVAAVMIHVADVDAGFDWYQRAFPDAIRKRINAPIDFEFLDVNGVMIEIVAADSKVGSGAAGSVVYWQVADFDAALSRLQRIGASLYRGPLAIENSQRMCQVRDPWGNCIGLRG
jgi:predicted enzyme related to lactoylglutathione lyase